MSVNYRIILAVKSDDEENKFNGGDGVECFKFDRVKFCKNGGKTINEELGIPKDITINKSDNILILFHASEIEKFRECMEYRNKFQSEFKNIFFFTYTIGGRGNPVHYGFVFDKKDGYNSREELLKSFIVYNKITDTELNDFREKFLSEFNLDKPIDLYEFSTYYPKKSEIPKDNKEKLEKEVRFYNEVYNKWDYEKIFRDNMLLVSHYPMDTEYGNFYYTEKKTKNNDYDLRRYFYDSSIWFRYKYNDEGKNQVRKLDSYRHKYKDYMRLNTAKITKFFHVRMFENSFVLGGENSHGQHIIPFKFHSETLMCNMADKELELIDNYLFNAGLKSWHWDIMLLDDYADKALKGDGEMKFSCDFGCYKGDLLTKENIVRHSLDMDKNGCIALNNTKITFNVEIKSDFPDPAENGSWYEKYGSDILLLDYLFTQNNQDGRPRYGDEVVKHFEDKKISTENSPLGKRWIFPVSAFNFVFIDSLASQGIDYFSSKMILSQGADPITTPNLFRYRFFKFLRLQLEELNFSDKNTLVSVFEELVNKNENEMKEYVRINFPKIVNVISKHKNLTKNEKHSSFAKSAINNLYFGEDNNSAIMSIQDFLFRLGFGDGQDIPRMAEIWEDLRVGSELKNKVGEILNKLKT